MISGGILGCNQIVNIKYYEMKKMVLVFVVGFVAALTFVHASYAQNKPLMSAVLMLKNPGAINRATDERINSRAIINFNKSYKGVNDAQWFEIKEGGSMCRFTDKNNLNRAYYDRKGNWRYTVTEYTEEKLPQDIRRRVKTTYYDYNISFAEKIDMVRDDKIVYLVQIQDEKSIKMLGICEDEMEVLEELEKLGCEY
jgi:hypothetical protein